MKTIILGVLFVLLYGGCHKPSLSPPNCSQEYDPPAWIPGTDCRNPCRFGYAGEVCLATGHLEAGCREVRHGLRIFLDSTSLKGPGRVPLHAVTIEAKEGYPERTGLFCRHDLFFESAEGELVFRDTLFVMDPDRGLSRIHLIPGPDALSGWKKRTFQWKIATRRPLRIR